MFTLFTFINASKGRPPQLALSLSATATLLFVALLLAPPLHASLLETLMMPGDLIAGHAKYEADCDTCHDSFNKEKQRRLCLDCHEDVANDITLGKGLHGLRKEIKKAECKSCHRDHLGRSANIIGLNSLSFDHKRTDFPLKESHATLSCGKCHKKTAKKKPTKYRDAPEKCVACHKHDDIHKGRLGKKCHDCHDEKSWKNSEFDHDKTDYPLKGKHKKVNCGACHTNHRYKNISTACNDCHYLEDIHSSRYGKKCHQCHTEKSWDKVRFNHDKKTKYKLLGSHKKTSCFSCHKTDYIYKTKPGKKCYDCHRHDDKHNGQYGKNCQECHDNTKWSKSSFDHDTETDFKLKGQHKELRCASCHRGSVYKEELDSRCISCHLYDDVHKGQQGKQCQRCHNDNGWTKKVVFDHDMTRFPLIGMHAVSTCEECHIDSVFISAATRCAACHKDDDIHKSRLGNDCEQCHNPNGWALWQFDHTVAADYALKGAHLGVDCLSCHKNTLKDEIELPKTCVACHQNDDIHAGEFGHRCERCHEENKFSNVQFAQ